VTTHTESPTHAIPLIGLLDFAHRLVAAELHQDLVRAGLGDIRGSHGCVFGNIEPDGSRLTELAERAGITKQAVGEVVADLERLGYVHRVPDPADGRAKIIRLTDAGQQAQAQGHRTLAEIEQRWAERYGEDRLRAMRELLERVVEDERGGVAPAPALQR
jgi:DNA-binding MarR family transcriptional regulator